MFPYVLILLVFLADRLSKRWALSFLNEHGPTQINNFISIQESYNMGIAFGMAQGIGAQIGWLTIVVVAGLFIYMVRLPQDQWLTRIGLALIIGGALGNMVDRLTRGEVLDFIVTPLRFAIFNVADIAINAGMVVIIVATVWSIRGARKPDLIET
jgi:signal peptidase II